MRAFLPRYAQPDADAIENLSMAIVVDQKRLGGGSHSTMGTITDIYSALRRLYSHAGKPCAGHASVFSFNDPKGMCPNCNGLGRKVGVDIDLFLDKSKAQFFSVSMRSAAGAGVCWANRRLFDMDKKLAKFGEKEMELLLYGTGPAEHPQDGLGVKLAGARVSVPCCFADPRPSPLRF